MVTLHPERATNRDEAKDAVERSLVPFEDDFDVDAIVDDLHVLFGGWDFEVGAASLEDQSLAEAYWGVVRKHDISGAPK